MPKKILLIENDAAFASELTRALEDAAFEVRATGDGREGIELARDWTPDAIVLCVELPGMSGYLVCQKLRKDDALGAIPLVLTSAEATPATIENHKKLKVRADEYLLKPYEPSALVDALATLIGLPDPAELDSLPPGADPEPLPDEELVNLEEEMGLEALSGDPVEDLPALDLSALPDEPVAPRPSSGGALDDELKLLDDAFAGLAAPPPGGDEALELDLGIEVKPQLDGPVPGVTRTVSDGALDAADAALGALAADEPGPAADELAPSLPDDLAEPERPASRKTVRGASADLLRAAGIRLLDDPPAPARGAPAGSEAPARLERELAEVKEALAAAKAEAAAKDGELRSLRARADDAVGELERLQAKLEAADARTREAEEELDALRGRAEAAEQRAAEVAADAKRKADAAAAEAVARADALERDLETLRTDLLVARGEAEGARGEIEKRTAELRQRVADLEATNAKHEERVVKAYQKIKADEKVREKVRKAIAIAAQLLDEGAPAESTAERERRLAAVPRE
ncbi:MAG TPA: response regulator [Anaeromyxobacter sp.]|nr:response regulator [Anaeromyxobacter sp.]